MPDKFQDFKEQMTPAKSSAQTANDEFELRAVMDAPQVGATPSAAFKESKAKKTKVAAEAPDLSKLEGDPLTKAGEIDLMEAPESPSSDWEVIPMFTDNLKASPVGTAIRVGLETGDIGSAINQFKFDFKDDTYQLTADDKQAFLDTEMPIEAFDIVMRNTKTREEYYSKLGIVKENREIQAKTAEAGLAGSIVGGIGDAIGDPLSYVPVAGVAAKGFQAAKITTKIVNNKLVPKLVESAATAYASESFLRNQITGQDADVSGAVIGSLAFTSALHGAGKGIKMMKDSTAHRIEASETARNLNREDPTVVKNHDGTSKIVDDPEGGQLEITESGKVMTAGLVPPKASGDGRFGRFADLATKAANADSPVIREIAAMFSRPTQGYQGKESFVAETPNAAQIKRSLDHRTNVLMSDMQDVLDDLVDRGNLFKRGAAAKRADYGKRIAHYIQGYIPKEQLSPQELKLAERIQQHYREQAGYMQDPSRLSGRSDAPSLHEKFIEDGSYVNRVYDQSKINALRSAHGDDAVVKAVADSWSNAYTKAGDKAHFDEVILRDYPDATEVTPEILADYTKRKAYGVVKGADDVIYDTDIFNDRSAGSSAGTRQLDFLKNRVPMNTMGDAMLGDQPFRLDDLIDYNLEANLGAYSRNVTGQVSLVAATGKSIDDLRAQIDALVPTTKADVEAIHALKEQMKSFMGQARRDYTMWDVLADSLRDATFTINNGVMWMANMAEIMGNFLTNPKLTAVAMKNMTVAMGRDIGEFVGMTPKELKAEFADVVAGQATATRMNLTYDKWLNGLAGRLGKRADELTLGERAAARIRYGTMKWAEKDPSAWLLNKTQEAIVNTGNQVGLGEMIAHAHGRKPTTLFSPKFLKANGIPQEVADRAIAYLKEMETHKVDPSQGKAEFDAVNQALREAGQPEMEFKAPDDVTNVTRDMWLSDPRSADVERILQAFNDELIMKQDGIGQQYYTPHGPAGRLLMQFKRFAVVSTQYAKKTTKDVAQHGRVDRAIAFMGSMFFSGLMFNVARTGYEAMWMDDPVQRRKYLDEKFRKDNLIVSTLQRTPLLSGYSMVYDTVGSVFGLPYAGMSKTTAGDMFTPENKKAASTAGTMSTLGNTAMGMVPAARTAAGIVSIGENTAKLAWDNLVDEGTLRRSQEQRAQREIAKSVGAMTSNDPMMKNLYRKLMDFIGVDVNAK